MLGRPPGPFPPDLANWLPVRPWPANVTNPVEELLHHATQAQEWQEAARYARQAGAKSLGLSANRQARIFLTQGLNALNHLLEGRERDELAVDIRLDMREALFRLGMLPEVVSRLSEAEVIADRLGDRRRRGQIIINLSHILWLTGDQVAASKVTERAVEYGREWHDEALGVRAVFQLGLIQLAHGEFMLSAGSMERMTAAMHSAPELLGRYGLDKALEALANSYAARAYTDLGHWEQAEAAVAESRRIADELDRPFSRLFAELAACYLALHRATAEAAMEAAEVAMWHCREADASLMSPVALTLLGAAQLRGGSVAPALEALRNAVTSAAAMRLLFNQPYRIALLAEAELRAGAADDALRSARRAIRLAARIGEPAAEALALRTSALILATAGAPERANRYYRRALTLAESMQMLPLIECCRSELAALSPLVPAIS
jgi:tetratricopeptide (TPR) repeat protein